MGKIVFIAPVLPVDAAAIARILADEGLLDRLVTRSLLPPLFAKILARFSVTKRFSRRPHSPIKRSLVTQSVAADIAFYNELRRTGSRTCAMDRSCAIVDRNAFRRVSGKHGAVLGREDCCERSFRRARELGVKTIYDLSTAYWRRVGALMEREAEEFSGICQTVQNEPNPQERGHRKDVELALSDHVLCPSTFVRDSLQSASTLPASIKTIPFASENHWLATEPSSRKPMFLYVGNITMRKGVHRLLITWKNLKAYRTHELRLIGDMRLSSNFLKDFQGMFTHIPRLRREELLQHYREASAFVFNAVADGFGYVILEALASATPVIASRNCGAPDVIEHRSEGLLIDYGAEEQLNSAIEWALSNPKELARMGDGALRKAHRWCWSNYAAEFISWLKERVLNQTFVCKGH